MPSRESDKLPHFLISDTAHTESYTPISSRGKTFQLPPRDRQSHGQKLLRQFDRIREESRTIISEQKAFGIDAGNGIYIQFESEPDFELKFESLEAIRSGIELLAVREAESKTFATVFVPEGKIHILTNKITDYLEKDTSPTSDKAKHKKLVESISEIKKAAIEALWTDELEVLPTEGHREIWWEVWLRAGNDPQGMIDFFKEHAQNIGFTLYPKEIRFPDRSVVAVYGTKEQMSRSVRLLNCIAELRMAKETADFFTAMDTIEQRSWADDLRDRTTPPPADCPMVCILDTGINNEHPLIQTFLKTDDLMTYDPSWNVNDHEGHGTEMAGLALYGDLTGALAEVGTIGVTHCLESVKILQPRGMTPWSEPIRLHKN